MNLLTSLKITLVNMARIKIQKIALHIKSTE